ncbi:DUF805 domain-containing protein [Novosphingobium sp.]|uniref:DUF805 domain-containing protein n=1 Tax=Novosphingobium sp. TaxID=1874826 RepID=UPI0033400526
MLSWMIMPYRRFADFGGRSRRREYWSFMLFYWLVFVVLTALFGHYELVVSGTQSPLYYATRGGSGLIGSVFALVSLIPHLAVAVRRLHDQDRSGLLLLLGLIPFLGWFALFVLLCLDGTRGSNRYGPDLKQPWDAGVFS